MWEMKYTFPSLVYLPTQLWNTLDKTLDNIFNNYQKESTLITIGDSGIYFYDSFIEAIKANDQTLGFPNTGDFLKNEFNRFKYKINKLYVNPRLSLHLDKGTIDHVIIDALRQWNCLYQNHYQGFIAIRRRYYDNEWMMQNITMAMFDENITFYNKYFKRVHFEHFIYKNFNENLYVVLHTKKFNTVFKKLYFLYYRLFEAFLFHNDYYTIGKIKFRHSFLREGWDYTSKQWTFGANLKWDVPDELYKGDNNLQSVLLPTGQRLNNIH
jgi:hypothetical protein